MTDLTLQFKRGSTAQNANYTGLAGELTVDTTKNSLRLHNGSTQGGFEIGTGSGGLAVTAIKTSAYTSVGNEIIRVDSATNAFTVTLPTTPTDGMLVTVVDVTGACGANGVTLTGGTLTVLGESTGVALDYAYATLELVYNSSTANWSSVNLPVAVTIAQTNTYTTTATSKTLVNHEYCVVTSAGVTLTLPATPVAGWTVTVGVGDFINTVIARNGSKIFSLAEDFIIDRSNATVALTYIDSTIGWRIA